VHSRPTTIRISRAALQRAALACAAFLACAPASAALLTISGGSTYNSVNSGAARNNVLGSGVAMLNNASLTVTAPAVLEFFYLGSESGFKNTLNVTSRFSHTDNDTIPGWAAPVRLFEVTVDAAGAVPMNFTSNRSGWGTLLPGGATGGKSIAFAYLECITSKSCVTTGPSNTVLFALDDGGGSPDDNDFDDYVGYLVARPLAATPTASAIAPPVPLPAAFWLLGSALLGLAGLARRRTT
jgi:hypothetical protein